MELRFRESAVADIGSFVTSYVEGFFELYSDTGVWSENVILQGVRSNGKGRGMGGRRGEMPW